MIPDQRQIADIIGEALRSCSPNGNLDHAARLAAARIRALVAGHIVERIEPDQGERLRLTIYAGEDGCTDIIEGPERWIISNLLGRFDGTGKLGMRKVKR